MNERIYIKFLQGVRWNFVESLAYRGIFLVHHLFLFKIVDAQLYGLVGTIFSSLYLVVALANFGLDHSIGVFYETSIKSKHHFNSLFLSHLWGQLYLFTAMGGLFVGACILFSSVHPLFALDSILASIIALALVSEGIKKTLRSLLQYAFLNKITSITEVVYLMLYVLIVWISYLFGITLSAFVLCFPFLCMSLLSTGFLALYLNKWYQELPAHNNHPLTPQVKKRFIHNRILNTINNIGRNVFTHNFLVALFAFKYGLQQAGTVKVVGTVSETLASFVYKAFSRMSNALLSHTKHLNVSEKQKTFAFLTYNIHQGIYCSALFLAINYPYIISLQKVKALSLSSMSIILLLVLPLFDHLFIAYERFYITEEKTKLLIGFNIIAASSFTVLISGVSSSTLLLMGLLAIRMGVFWMMSFVAYSYWKIKPNWQLQPKLLGGTIVVAGIFFVLTNYSRFAQLLSS